MRVFFIRFQTAYHGRAQTALPFAMNSEFSRVLSTEMVSKAGHPQSMFIGNVNNNNCYNNYYDNYCNNHCGCLLLSQLLQSVIWLFPSICYEIEKMPSWHSPMPLTTAPEMNSI